MTDTELEALLGSPTRQTEARGSLRDRLDREPKTTSYLRWHAALPAIGDPQRIAVLSSFTIRTIDPFLQVEAYLAGWRLTPTYIEYNLWQQALLDAEAFSADGVRAIVLALHRDGVLGEQSLGVGQAAVQFASLVKAFRQKSSVALFVAYVDAPADLVSLATRSGEVNGSTGVRQALQAELHDVPDVHWIELPLQPVAPWTWFDPVAYHVNRTVLAHRVLPSVARAIARPLACLFRPRRKLLVLDLDNTLWGGVVGEDGVDGIAIGSEYPGSAYRSFQRELLRLRASGVLLALASKNNEADARTVFESRPEMLLSWDHFSARAINWNDKASNIASMAGSLGLGLDSIVFADDSDIECAHVRQVLPEVEVVNLGNEPARYADRLLQCAAFDALQLSSEDLKRADGYASEAERRLVRETAKDLATFLAQCEIELQLRCLSSAELDRVHQLLGKTNQFNFSLERLSKENLIDAMNRGGRVYTASLKDRFGDYGLIGVLQVEPGESELRISNLALSCRALGRGVEDALLAFTRERAIALGQRVILARCTRGPRNQQVFDYIERCGFKPRSSRESTLEFELELTAGALPWPTFIAVEKPSDVVGA